jgi:hypothetical protein
MLAEQREGEKVAIPASPIQRRALVSMLITLATIISVTILYLRHGVVAMSEVDSLRHLFTLIVIATALIDGATMIPFIPLAGSKRLLADERDRQILRGAPAFQGVTLLLLSVIWAIALTEGYWYQQAIPIQYPNLIFWTNVLFFFLSWSVGVLYGYWRMNVYGE